MKFYAHFLCLRRDESHPARGAWIEMETCYRSKRPRIVAPRKGCVD